MCIHSHHTGGKWITGWPVMCLLVLLFSCETQDICNQDNQSVLVALFKTGSADRPADTLIGGMTVHGIREGKSNSLLYDSVAVSRIILPLDPAHGDSRFVLRVGQQSDTIGVKHDNTAYLISYACGFAMRFTLQKVDHTLQMIKGVEVIDGQVDAELLTDEVHLWIFF